MDTIYIIILIVVLLLMWVYKLQRELLEQSTLQDALIYEAEHDSLTGLPNGILFVNELTQSIETASKIDKKIAVLYLGLDNFTATNDAYGTEIGDAILIEMTHALKHVLGDDDNIARLGGDEFIIMINHFDDIPFLRSLIAKIMNIADTAFVIEGHKVQVPFSLGIALYPDNHLSPNTILEYASFAMREVKKNGRGYSQFYTEEFADEVARREKLREKLLQSLENQEMELHYQLQVDSKTANIIGIEALLRWNHPELGLLKADRFLPLAEEMNFLHNLEHWLIQASISQFAQWHKKGFQTGKLFLNLSPQKLIKVDFIPSIERLLIKNPSVKKYLQFKLDESKVMQNLEACTPHMQKLAHLGVNLCFNKFGLGYSSISALQELSIKEVRLDASLVHNIELLRTLLTIAKSLRIQVSAAGVETEEQSESFQEEGCVRMQGSLYHLPSPVDVINKILLRSLEK